MALICACHSGNVDLIKKIIELGAECFDYAIYNSCFYRNEEVIDLLLKYNISEAWFELCLIPPYNVDDENIINILYKKWLNAD